ncbi:beta-galactosidase [bacterium]|nr:beta-galactosidase [bacterium]
MEKFKWFTIIFPILFASYLLSAEPENLIRGAFEVLAGWEIPPEAKLDKDIYKSNPPSLRIEGSGRASYVIFCGEGGGRYTLSGWVKTKDVIPTAEKGYAFLAIYQYDAFGNLLEFKDIAQPTGTQDWTFYSYSFTTPPGTFYLEVTCGIWQAGGIAWFDDLALTKGDEPLMATKDKPLPPPTGKIAILKDEIPPKGALTPPELFYNLLREAGYSPEFISAEGLKDNLKREKYDLLILSYGESFPAESASALFNFLKDGGSLFTTGGYAFQNPLYKMDDKWLGEEEANAIQPNLFPAGDFQNPSLWKRGEGCSLDETNPFQGKPSAKVFLLTPSSSDWHTEVNLPPGKLYRFSGFLKTKDVKGGYAFAAIYCYDKEGNITLWRDVGKGIGTTDWQSFSWDFSPPLNTTRIVVRCGIYQGQGEAWFNSFEIKERLETRINTAKGEPMDSLIVQPYQIGMFDPSYKLERVAYAEPAKEGLIDWQFRLKGPLIGYSASGVTGSDSARWIPLIKGYDRYGRLRGSIGALLLHYSGFYATSRWAFFGVENQDIFQNKDMQKAFLKIVKHLLQGTFLHNLTSEFFSYNQGEPVKISVKVSNYGKPVNNAKLIISVEEKNTGKICFNQEFNFSLASGERKELTTTWQEKKFNDNLYRIKAVLYLNNEKWDWMESGFLVKDEKLLKNAKKLTYKDNYLWFDGEPRFILGTDDYSDTLLAARMNPLVWDKELRMLKDYGVDLYENLWISPAYYNYQIPEDIWRRTDALSLLTQKHNLVFFPCILCGYNVAVSDEEREKQKEICSQFAQRYHILPSLIYYINGDLQFNENDARKYHKPLFNEFLKSKYKNKAELEEAWKLSPPQGEWGDIELPRPKWGNWEDAATADLLSFYGFLARKWISTMSGALKAVDPQHPTTCEFYQLPVGGIDLREEIDDLDISNIGYFGPLKEDIIRLPPTLKYHDLRSLGKTFSLGEFGAKTHPAWLAGPDYHIKRSEEERNKLFLAAIFYSFGMGASRANNWCFLDPSSWVFPWGLFYPCDEVPKECAKVMRAGGFLLRQIHPAPAKPPSLYLLIPTQNRVSGVRDTIHWALIRSINTLISLGVDFWVIDEPNIEQIPDSVKAIIYPLPFCPPDSVYEWLKSFVQKGGKLFISGDISYDGTRQRKRTDRLEELCGVQFQSEVEKPVQPPPPGKPMIKVEPKTAESVLGSDILFHNRFGNGDVFFTPYVEELRPTSDLLSDIYLRFLQLAGVERLKAVKPDSPSLHRFHLKTFDGEVVTLFNQGEKKNVYIESNSQRISLTVGNNMPALVHTTKNGVLKVVASGIIEINRKTVFRSDAHIILFSLDGKPINDSECIFLIPLEEGEIKFSKKFNVDIGELVEGKWKRFERIPSTNSLKVDGDIRFTPCILYTSKPPENEWLERLLLP